MRNGEQFAYLSQIFCAMGSFENRKFLKLFYIGYKFLHKTIRFFEPIANILIAVVKFAQNE